MDCLYVWCEKDEYQWWLRWGWAWALLNANWTDWTANTWWGWGWRRWDNNGSAWAWGSWVVVLAYKTDWSDWVSTSSTWWTVNPIALSKDNSNFITQSTATWYIWIIAPWDYLKITYSSEPTLVYSDL